jgi:hypothetical protein
MFFEGDDTHWQFSFPWALLCCIGIIVRQAGIAIDAITARRGELVAIGDQFAIRMHSTRISLLLMLSQSARYRLANKACCR